MQFIVNPYAKQICCDTNIFFNQNIPNIVDFTE